MPPRTDEREPWSLRPQHTAPFLQWAALPKDLPARSTVWDYVRRWNDDGTLDRIHRALCPVP